jgi:type III restriction enzyme
VLQAQNSTEQVNADALGQHLKELLHIPKDQIKIATGTQRELEGLDVSARDYTVIHHHRSGFA